MFQHHVRVVQYVCQYLGRVAHILIYFLGIHPLVSLDLCASFPVCLDGSSLIFYISRSKVKGQGKMGMKMYLFGHKGYVCVRSGPGRVRWGTFGSVPTISGSLPNVVKQRGALLKNVSHYWQCAILAGKVPRQGLVKVPILDIADEKPFVCPKCMMGN